MQFDMFRESEPQSDLSPSVRATEPSRTSRKDVLCWSKMQAEAGQPLDAIIRRKELERAAGDGCFYWGIGNSLGSKAQTLGGVSVPMIFSKMLSKPKAEDGEPDSVFIWTAFVDRDGREQALPDHTVITSRARTSSGDKTRHYALVCHSTRPLEISGERPFNPDAHRNYMGAKLGPSQVTALLEAAPDRCAGPGRYTVDIEVRLRAPYCIRLVRPALASPEIRNAILGFGNGGATAAEWRKFAITLRRSIDKLARSDHRMNCLGPDKRFRSRLLGQAPT